MPGSGFAMKCPNSNHPRIMRLQLPYHADRALFSMRLAEPRPSRPGLFSLSSDLGWDDFDGSSLAGGGQPRPSWAHYLGGGRLNPPGQTRRPCGAPLDGQVRRGGKESARGGAERSPLARAQLLGDWGACAGRPFNGRWPPRR